MEPTIAALFDDQAFRLQGVPTWAALPSLGRRNLHRLAHLAQTRAASASGLDPAERRDLAAAVKALHAMAAAATTAKPLLPRLRAGHPGTIGASVWLYLGDTPGLQAEGWRRGVVTDIVKDFKAEWAVAKDKGYYWRLTVTLDDGRRFATSSSEPRMLTEADMAYLMGPDQEFAKMYAKNASRDWQPIWCEESGVQAHVGAMDFGAWLVDGPR